jgi:hypothetical protein
VRFFGADYGEIMRDRFDVEGFAIMWSRQPQHHGSSKDKLNPGKSVRIALVALF